ncbi:MAG: hypothetical protein ACON3Z_11125 [Bradymonadia bacterium]
MQCRIGFVLVLLMSGCSGEGAESAAADTETSTPMTDGGAAASDGTVDGMSGPEPCVPDEGAWADARATLEQYCGFCHGETPAYGAPYTLLNYESLVAGDIGARPIDRAVERIRIGDMPPVGQPEIPAQEALAFLDWATCGENTDEPEPGPNPGGFDVSRPVFVSPDTPPAESTFVEFRADNGYIPPDVSDQYTCFSFSGPDGGDRYIRRLEPIIDDARVLHHIVLYEVPEGAGDGRESDCATNLDAAIYAWAPGQQAMQFLEGGLVTDANRRYVMEIHYNNSAGYDDVADQSGVRIYHSEPEGPAIDMFTIGPDGFRLPARERTAVSGDCEVDEPLTIIASLPHMHELGVSLQSTITRSAGGDEDLITLTGWDFDAQLFYDTGALQLQPGDQIKTECVFENTTDRVAAFGPYTEDEMCYNFLFVTPPPSERRCNVNAQEFEYEPGECAPERADEVAVAVNSPARLGSPMYTAGGEPPSGLWRLIDYTLYFDSANIGLAELDLDASSLSASGALYFSSDLRIQYDVAAEIDAVFTNGGGATQSVGFSFSGVMAAEGLGDGQLNITTDCPGAGEVSAQFSYDGERLSLYLPFAQMASGVAVPTFELVEADDE